MVSGPTGLHKPFTYNALHIKPCVGVCIIATCNLLQVTCADFLVTPSLLARFLCVRTAATSLSKANVKNCFDQLPLNIKNLVYDVNIEQLAATLAPCHVGNSSCDRIAPPAKLGHGHVIGFS